METKICKVCGKELPLESFKVGRYGVRVGVCTHCATEKLRANKEAKRKQADEAKANAEKGARNMRLQDFSPRELIEELKRRGYSGKLEYTETHVIDIENF